MSYHSSLGQMPSPFTSTTAFAQAVDPYTWRFSPPGAVYAPYGWGPDFNIGMPFNYTHHLDYVRQPVGGMGQLAHRIRGARPVGPMFDVLPGIGPEWSLRYKIPREVMEYQTRFPHAVGPPDMVPIRVNGTMRYVKLTPQTMRIRRAQEKADRVGALASWNGGHPGSAHEASSGSLAGMLAVM